MPHYLEWFRENLPLVIGIAVFVSGICGLVGYLIGKSAANKRMIESMGQSPAAGQ